MKLETPIYLESQLSWGLVIAQTPSKCYVVNSITFITFSWKKGQFSHSFYSRHCCSDFIKWHLIHALNLLSDCSVLCRICSGSLLFILYLYYLIQLSLFILLYLLLYIYIIYYFLFILFYLIYYYHYLCLILCMVFE